MESENNIGIQMEDLKEGLAHILKIQKPRRIFLVTGSSSFEKSGAKKVFDEVFESAEVTIFTDYSPNPKIEDVKKGIEVHRSVKPDLMIAVGGGSAIDIAKAINILSVQKGDPEGYVKGEVKISKEGVPLVAVPTTSGTGSEVTHFAVVYIGKQKYSLASPCMLPDFFILDPSLTYSLPPKITASTGMDAFSQSVESYWSNKSTDESKKYAREAISLVMNYFVKAVRSPSEESRRAMLKAAHLSGKAINITKTTASHAMSYGFTSNFDVPHGHAVGLTLASLLIYNGGVTEKDVLDPRGKRYVERTMKDVYTMLGVRDKEEASVAIESFMKDVGLETKLSKLGVREDSIEMLLEDISEERAGNNPRRFTKEIARTIFENIL